MVDLHNQRMNLSRNSHVNINTPVCSNIVKLNNSKWITIKWFTKINVINFLFTHNHNQPIPKKHCFSKIKSIFPTNWQFPSLLKRCSSWALFVMSCSFMDYGYAIVYSPRFNVFCVLLLIFNFAYITTFNKKE